jgi:polysaccharide pyruvyl transferase WcaK-like protein
MAENVATLDDGAVNTSSEAPAARTPVRVGLLWHSPRSGNLGVGALTLANMAIVRGVAHELGLEPQFRIIGMADTGPVYLQPSEAEVYIMNSRSLLSPGGCWAVMGHEDCVLDIGAGDSFADIYGFKRFVFLWLTKMLAIGRGTPLMLSPQTIGPFTRQPYKALAGLPLTGATAVFARDRMSLEALGRLAPRAKSHLSIDVAFALPYEDRSHLRGGPKTRVGVNVSGLLFNEAESGRNKFGLDVDYAKLMRGFIGALSQRPDVEVHLITHVTEPGENHPDDDGVVADRLAREFPGAIRVPNFPGPCEAKSYISGLDFLTAGRMHACIGAFSAGTPVVPVAYSRKFSGLFGLLNYPWMVPVKGADTEQGLAYLLDAVSRREALAADIARGMAEVETLLDAYRAELRGFLAAAAR